ncbi:MAG: type II toxin-antitoxin system HicB family antitoxin [Egibacteraceae bacterium]
MRLTAAIHQEDTGYVARCLETGVASQGETFEEARQNLIEAVELHYRGEDLSDIEPSPALVPIEVNLPVPERLAG